MLSVFSSCEKAGGIKGKEAAERENAKSKVLEMEQIWKKVKYQGGNSTVVNTSDLETDFLS